MTSVVLQISHKRWQVFKNMRSAAHLPSAKPWKAAGWHNDSPHPAADSTELQKWCCSPAPQNVCVQGVEHLNWGLRLWPNVQATRLLNCHFQASQWVEGSVCHSPGYLAYAIAPCAPMGRWTNRYWSACFACMGLLLVLTNLFVLSPDGGKKREVQIYSVSVMEDQTDFIHKWEGMGPSRYNLALEWAMLTTNLISGFTAA